MKFLLGFLTFLIPFLVQASEGPTWYTMLLGEHPIIPEHVAGFFLVAIVLIIIAFLYKARISKIKDTVVPDSKISLRNLVEAYGQFMYGQCSNVLGPENAKRFFPFAATFFIVILCTNLLGLIPGCIPPTQFFSTTFALAAFSFAYYNIKGCQEQGIVHYIKHFAGPVWYMAILIFPIEILSNCVRLFSLSIRLRGNMLGDHQVLATFSHLTPYIIPIIFLCLGILICVIQAYVFTLLSLIYIDLVLAKDKAHT